MAREAARLTPDIIWTGLRTRLGTRAMRRRAFMQLVMPDGYLRTRAPTLADDWPSCSATISRTSRRS